MAPLVRVKPQLFYGPGRPAPGTLYHQRARPHAAPTGAHCRAGGGKQTVENQGGNLDAGYWEINFIFGGHAVAHMCGIAAIGF
tara:strand:+ start:13858 stop:14106 length:249 start_codon:yes stop_codon:yes gene_type:complete